MESVDTDFTTAELNLADLRSSCASLEKKCQLEPNVENIIIISSLTKTVKSSLERFASILNEETRLTFLDRSYDNNDVLKYQAIVHEAPCAFISELNTLEIRPDEQPNLTPDLLADIHSLFDEDAADQFPGLLKTCEPSAPLNPATDSNITLVDNYDNDFDFGYDTIEADSNYYNENYDDAYGRKRKRRSADYWDYDYKLYDFDYEPGCSLSYQQTQVSLISALMMAFRNVIFFYIIILSSITT